MICSWNANFTSRRSLKYLDFFGDFVKSQQYSFLQEGDLNNMVSDWYCSNCRRTEASDGRFCSQCGTAKIAVSKGNKPTLGPPLPSDPKPIRIGLMIFIGMVIVGLASLGYTLVTYRINWRAMQESAGILAARTPRLTSSAPTAGSADPDDAPPLAYAPQAGLTAHPGQPTENDLAVRSNPPNPTSYGVYALDGKNLVELENHSRANGRFTIPIYDFANSQPVILVYLQTDPQAIAFCHPESETNFIHSSGGGVQGEMTEARVTPMQQANLYRVEPVRPLPAGFTIVCVPAGPSILADKNFYGIRMP